tara:strand:+ start:11591 stop:12385 length:795 start_codon:yes stop_codon:yes gene_type:complete
MSFLQSKHPHIKDKDVTFYDPTHTYTITCKDNNGEKYKDKSFTSVTTWIHSLFSGFDADKIITKMMLSHKWPESKYYGMTPDEIKAQWDKNRDESAKQGTKLHYDIECYYNNVDVENDTIEYKWFLDFDEVRKNEKLIPYRTEMIVYDEELKLVGSIDMLYEEHDGTLQIYDWKRCKEIKKTNIWENSVVDCISYIPNSNFWHYSLQLNTYKRILEKNYDKKVSKLCLVCLHPDNKNKSYIKINIPILDEEMNRLFEYRKTNTT